MTNLLNSQITNNYNVVPARRISSENNRSRCIEAPKTLPKYSIEDSLKQKEEFRKSVIQQQNIESFTNKKKSPAKVIIVLAAIAGFFLLKGKK